jgi:hypothetical protein
MRLTTGAQRGSEHAELFLRAPLKAYLATLGGRSTFELMFVFVFVEVFAV